MKKLIFGGVESADFSVFISGEGTYDSPARVFEAIDIPGRNGQLIIDRKRFENIPVTYPAFIFKQSDTDFNEAVEGLRNALSQFGSYQRLTDEYHPDEFRLALFAGPFNTAPILNKAGEFELIFNCKPQRFLLSGETAVTISGTGTLTNPTLYEAKPLIKVTGNGTVEVGSYSFTVANNANDDIYLDSEIQECYGYDDGALINRNADVTLTDFPLLHSGNNGVDSGELTVEIIPRWWRI